MKMQILFETSVALGGILIGLLASLEKRLEHPCVKNN